MLMITVNTESAIVALRLDGKLAGSHAHELARTRSAVGSERPDETVLIDLTGVTAIDDVGKEFLAQAHSNGDRLIAGAGTRAIIDEIAGRSRIKDPQLPILGVKGDATSTGGDDVPLRRDTLIRRR